MDNAATAQNLINELAAKRTGRGFAADARADRVTVVPDVPSWCGLVTDPRTRPVSLAREHALAVLQGDDLAEAAIQIVSELVTNAGAPRSALSYPRFSREELKGGFWV